MFDQVHGQVKGNPFKRMLLNKAIAAKGLDNWINALEYSFEYF